MSNTSLNSYEYSFKNAQTWERYEATPKDRVHGFGVVHGKHFTLITKDDSYISQLWFSFLKLIRYIKTDVESIDTLHQHTITKRKTPEYLQWADENKKYTNRELETLKKEKNTLLARLSSAETTNENLEKELKSVQKEAKKYKKGKKKYKSNSSALEKENNLFQKAWEHIKPEKGLIDFLAEHNLLSDDDKKDPNAKNLIEAKAK